MHKILSTTLLIRVFLFGLSIPASMFAANVEVGLEPPQKPTGFLEDWNFRFLEATPYPNGAESHPTHIVLDGLFPVGGAGVYEAEYRAIEIGSDRRFDSGVVLMDLPPTSLSDGSVVTPMVGLFPREARWSDYHLDPASNGLGFASGIAEYVGTDGLLHFSLAVNGNPVTGSARYMFDTSDAIVLEPFSLAMEENSFAFAGGTIHRVTTDMWQGVVAADLSGQESADVHAMTIKVRAIADIDNNGIPDFLDNAPLPPRWYSGSVRLDGEGPGHFRSPWLGDYFAWSPDHDAQYIFHSEHGYWFVFGTGEASAYFWDTQLGWIWTAGWYYPYIYRFSPASWLYYYVGTGSASATRIFWVFDPSVGEADWYSFPQSN